MCPEPTRALARRRKTTVPRSIRRRASTRSSLDSMLNPSAMSVSNSTWRSVCISRPARSAAARTSCSEPVSRSTLKRAAASTPRARTAAARARGRRARRARTGGARAPRSPSSRSPASPRNAATARRIVSALRNGELGGKQRDVAAPVQLVGELRGDGRQRDPVGGQLRRALVDLVAVQHRPAQHRLVLAEQTISRSATPDATTASSVCATSGRSPSERRFLFGTPRLSPRAGTIASRGAAPGIGSRS